MTPVLSVEGLRKIFVLHNQGRISLPILGNTTFSVSGHESVVITGVSGSGKSTLLRLLYGNYRPTSGRIDVRHRGDIVNLATAPPRTILDVRRWTIGWVSQFLRVIPRVSTLDLVREPLLLRDVSDHQATERACAILERVNLPRRLWTLAPQTFSGGEQQRVNIARSFVAPSPLMLLDEPTASLDQTNRDIVIELIAEVRAAGSAIIGIFHDEATRERVATRLLDVTAFKSEAQHA